MDAPSRALLPVGSCDTVLPGGVNPRCIPCQGGEQAGVPDDYRVTVSHTPGEACVGHTHGGLETQALQGAADSSLLG